VRGLSYRPDILPAILLRHRLRVLHPALQGGPPPLVHIPHQASPVIIVSTTTLARDNNNNKNNNTSQSKALEAPHYRICQSQSNFT